MRSSKSSEKDILATRLAALFKQSGLAMVADVFSIAAQEVDHDTVLYTYISKTVQYVLNATDAWSKCIFGILYWPNHNNYSDSVFCYSDHHGIYAQVPSTRLRARITLPN